MGTIERNEDEILTRRGALELLNLESAVNRSILVLMG
jgi:hypothetical protein